MRSHQDTFGESSVTQTRSVFCATKASPMRAYAILIHLFLVLMTPRSLRLKHNSANSEQTRSEPSTIICFLLFASFALYRRQIAVSQFLQETEKVKKSNKSCLVSLRFDKIDMISQISFLSFRPPAHRTYAPVGRKAKTLNRLRRKKKPISYCVTTAANPA